MQVASVLNVHANPDLVRDNLDAQRVWVTDRILLIVDAAGWEHFQCFSHPDTVVAKGIHHGAKKSPYKNMGIGLLKAYKLWPDADWYCYSEYDTLFISDGFKEDLERATGTTVVFLGYRPQCKTDSKDHWLVQELLAEYGDPICWKSIGCLMFFSNFCMQIFVESNFIERMLDRTSQFSGAEFPDFYNYAVEEILYPSAASVFGDIRSYDGFGGPSERYQIKFGGDLHPDTIRDAASVIHPVKDYDHPIRKHFREVRQPFLE